MALDNPPSPWRPQRLDEYLSRHRPSDGEDSFFLQLLQANDDKRHFVLWRGTHFFITLHRRPYNNGHLLIIPYRPVTGYRDLTTAEHNALADVLEHTMQWLREALQAEGYNVGMNDGNFAESREPNHLHIHVVPRWHGDTNFMTAVNETRVIPESLEDTYERLREVIP